MTKSAETEMTKAETAAEPAAPVVAVMQDPMVFPMRLPDVLGHADCEVYELYPNVDLLEALGTLKRPPRLLILPVRSDSPETVQRVRDLRALPEFRELSILGVVAAADRAGLDLSELRSLGLAGLVDCNAVPEHVIFRVNQMVRSYPERRRCLRAPAFLPIELEAAGHTTTEYAVSLSVGGLGLSCSRVLEPNTDVRLGFRCGGQDVGEIKGRVLHCTADPNAVPCNRVGIVFYPLAEEQHAMLEREVERLLDSRKASGASLSPEEV